MFQPVNQNATKEVVAVLNYLEAIKGKGILIGQHTQTMGQPELWYLERMTGKLPALCGFELLSYSPNIQYLSCDQAALTEIYENRNTVQRAYEWAERGGLLTFTWHWFSPIGGRDKSFFADNTDFDATQILLEDTPERAAFYRDMDVIAEILQGFREKNIPILWRPFHEAEGNWFWWGRKGMDVAKELYRLMFTYYTEVKHLDNLIWVWNNPRPEGYVGDSYCDIVSGDWYLEEHAHTSYKEQYEILARVTPHKPVAIGENGSLPSVKQIAEDRLDWLWFMTWSGVFVLSDRFTAAEVWKEQFRHPHAITLDKLPRLYG